MATSCGDPSYLMINHWPRPLFSVVEGQQWSNVERNVGLGLLGASGLQRSIAAC